jgi:hypothetical protein
MRFFLASLYAFYCEKHIKIAIFNEVLAEGAARRLRSTNRIFTHGENNSIPAGHQGDHGGVRGFHASELKRRNLPC